MPRPSGWSRAHWFGALWRQGSGRTNPKQINEIRSAGTFWGADEGPLFLNIQGRRLSRSGIAYILRKLAACAGLSPQHAARISPHVIRHTTAMHLLQAGVDITTIAAWLGHSQLSTTHGYVEINLRMKQEAVAAAAALPELAQGEFPQGDLLTWLSALGRPQRYAQKPPPSPAHPLGRGGQLRITGHSP